MSKTEKMKSHANKASIKILKTEENFTGFDVDDNLLSSIETKKNGIINIFSSEKSEPIEVCTPTNSTSIVNNNHVNKKSQSKSRISSPESKHNRSVKKAKKDHVQSEAVESVDTVNVQPSLELTTPTFNLTSSITSNRRNSGRKQIVDITDPIFKLPFEYGWKRELVYRTTGDNSAVNRGNRNGDVYYYSPNNRKLRSLREIQEQLNLSLDEENPLTIDSFTFLKQPIGMNDKSKELIREANTKVPKEDSFTGVGVRPKKGKTPIHISNDYKLSDNENKKSSTKVKVVFKNVKRSRSKSKKDKNDLETINTSSSNLDYIAEDWQAIKDSETSNNLPSKTDEIPSNLNNERRLSTSDGEVFMVAPCGIRCFNSQEPATLMCTQCLVYYHPTCVKINSTLKIVGYICINCRTKARNRREQSSHSVVVGASEPEQLRVEPIRIRQVQQASDTPNFFIDRTPISKPEEPNYEIEEQYINENNSDNTVICQGNVYKTAMVDGSFHEQYVYEMKQTRGPSLMTCVVQEPINLDENPEMNGALREYPNSMTNMQSFNHMVKSLQHVFKYLKTHELLSASRVCYAWKIIAMDRSLWQTVRLKNSMVCNWSKCISAIHDQGSVSLDMRRMLIPTKIEDFDKFWLEFTMALKKAQKLKCLELYRCSANVVEDTIYSLPQLSVLNATSIKNPNISKEGKNPNEFMTLSLRYLGQMTNLTEVRIKGLTGMKLVSLPSFESLVNLKSLSLTSIKAFPKEVCRTLETLPTSLAFFEIGDCDCLSKDFAVVLKRLTNLTSLRLENCSGRFDNFSKEVLSSIRGLDKLKILELINIEFSNNVEDELEKCTNIKALLIIPAYVSQSATTNCHLIDCLKKLKKTLTHLVWGLTHELLRVTDLFITQYQQNQHTIGYDLELSHTKEPTNNIPILRTRKPRQRPGEESVTDKDKDKDNNKSDNVDILSVPALEKLLETLMINGKSKVVKIPFATTTRVYLLEHFNDL